MIEAHPVTDRCSLAKGMEEMIRLSLQNQHEMEVSREELRLLEKRYRRTSANREAIHTCGNQECDRSSG
jgi:hypothetical protein